MNPKFTYKCKLLQYIYLQTWSCLDITVQKHCLPNDASTNNLSYNLLYLSVDFARDDPNPLIYLAPQVMKHYF